MKEILAILDTDAAFAGHLKEKLNEDEAFPYQVFSFSTEEELGDFLKDQEISLLLLSQDLAGRVGEFAVRQIIFLTDIQGYANVETKQMLFKYQPVSKLKEAILAFGKNREEISARAGETISRCAFFGVLSTAGSGITHNFSIVLGQLLSQSARVLYVTLEPFSSYRELFDWDYPGDLSELVYERSVRKKLPEVTPYILDFHGLRLLCPIRLAEDLNQMNPVDIFETVREVGCREGMDIVILNFGTSAGAAEAMIPFCERIYVPVTPLTPRDSLIPLRDFLKRLDPGDRRGVEEVRLPVSRTFKSGKATMDQLLWSETGDAVRKQLGEQAEWTF